MNDRLTRRDFGVRTVGFGLAVGLAAHPPAHAHGAPVSGVSSVPSDPYAVVDPELLPALKQFPAADFSPEMIGQVRRMPGIPALPVPAPQPVERYIPGPPGAPALRLWIVDPAPSDTDKPVLLHLHGGGFTMPDPWLLPRLQGIATDCGCVVVSVDYRLAPETRHAGSLADSYTALRWVHAHAAELGIDRNRIAVGGESAGGYHAARLAIHARDRREVPILFQLLIYPALDDRTGSARPVPPAIGHFIWTASANRFAWSALLGVPAGSTRVPADAVPARTADVAGLPPAWIGVGSIDLFVEEDMAYAARLVHAGVPTELVVEPGAFHGFDFFVPEATAAQRFNASWKSALRRAFATARAG